MRVITSSLKNFHEKKENMTLYLCMLQNRVYYIDCAGLYTSNGNIQTKSGN